MCSERADAIAANQIRCQKILECKREIESWKSKLEALEQEQEIHIKCARLRLDTATTWRSLSRDERLQKRFILAALESVESELPKVLTEQEFPNSDFFPLHIRLDRDILLARVARPDFAKQYANTYNDGRNRFYVPPKLRADKEVILRILPKHPQAIECISCKLRDDPDILIAMLSNQSKASSPSLPSHFLQHFSERLRADKDLMLKVLKHQTSSLAFCAHSLKNDKEFVSLLIEGGNESDSYGGKQPASLVLRYVSQRLRADRELVLCAVSKSGLNLKHAAYPLRRDEGIVRAAVAENAAAFRYCLPSPIKDHLLCDRQFVLELAKTAPKTLVYAASTENGHGIIKFDRQILLEAIGKGLEWSNIPESLQENKDFVQLALEQNPKLYMDLSEEMRETFEIAFKVVAMSEEQEMDDVILEATERCPILLSNRYAMTAIVKNWRADVLQETLQFSPLEIRSDKDIMIEAVKNDSIAFEFCSDELQTDRDIVMAAIDTSPNSLYLVSDTFQRANPDVVIRAIQNTTRSDLWTTYDDVCEEMWSNRDVAMAWLSKGGDYLLDDFPEEFDSDEELFLEVVKHNWTEFDNASDELKGKKEFLLRALALDGRVIRDVSDDLRHDFDLTLVAFSSKRQAIQFYSGPEDFVFLVSLAQHVRERLEAHHFFHNEVILKGILLSSGKEDCKSTWALLNQGPDTLSMYTTSIAAYLGLPDANKLLQLNETSNNLFAWGF